MAGNFLARLLLLDGREEKKSMVICYHPSPLDLLDFTTTVSKEDEPAVVIEEAVVTEEEDPAMALQESMRLLSGHGLVSPHLDLSQTPPHYEPTLLPYDEMTRASPSSKDADVRHLASPTGVTQTRATPRTTTTTTRTATRSSGRIATAERFRHMASSPTRTSSITDTDASGRSVPEMPSSPLSSSPLTHMATAPTEPSPGSARTELARGGGGKRIVFQSTTVDHRRDFGGVSRSLSTGRRRHDHPATATTASATTMRAKSAGRAQQQQHPERGTTNRKPASPSLKKTKQYARDMASTDHFLRGVVQAGFTAGKHVTECALLTTDIYQQECSADKTAGAATENGPHLHDADDAFFVASTDTNHSISMDDNEDDSEILCQEEEESGLVEPPKLINEARRQRQRSIVDVEETKRAGTTAKDDYDKDDEGGLWSDAIFRSLKGINVTQFTGNRRSSTESTTTARAELHRPRGAYDLSDKDEEEKKEERFESFRKEELLELSTDYTDLRELRLRVLEQEKNLVDNEEEGKNSPLSTKYSRTLDDLAKQDSAMAQLRQELLATRASLDRAHKEVMETKQKAAMQRQATTQSSTKIFRERVEVEERLRRELKLSAKLTARIAEMEKKAAKLETELVRAKEKATAAAEKTASIQRQNKVATPLAEIHVDERSPAPDNRSPLRENEREESSVGADKETTMLLSAIVALRAEVVELRAQLAESRASQLATEEDRHRAVQEKRAVEEEVKTLRSQNKNLQSELDELKGRLRGNSSNKEDTEAAEDTDARILKEEVTQMRLQVEKTKAHAAEKAQAAQKLEEELTETQDEASRLRSQVTNLMKTLDQTKKQADEKIQVSDEEAKRLQEEVQRMKDKFIASKTEILNRDTDHVKEKQRIEEELLQAKEVADRLQHCVLKLDDKVSQAESEAEQLRSAAATQIETEIRMSPRGGIRRISGDVMGLLRNMRERDASDI